VPFELDLVEVKKEIEKYRKMIKRSYNVIELELAKSKVEEMLNEIEDCDECETLKDELEDLLVDLIIEINMLKKEQSCGLH